MNYLLNIYYFEINIFLERLYLYVYLPYVNNPAKNNQTENVGNVGNVGKWGKCGKMWEKWENVGKVGKCGKMWEKVRKFGLIYKKTLYIN